MLSLPSHLYSKDELGSSGRFPSEFSIKLSSPVFALATRTTQAIKPVWQTKSLKGRGSDMRLK